MVASESAVRAAYNQVSAALPWEVEGALRRHPLCRQEITGRNEIRRTMETNWEIFGFDLASRSDRVRIVNSAGISSSGSPVFLRPARWGWPFRGFTAGFREIEYGCLSARLVGLCCSGGYGEECETVESRHCERMAGVRPLRRQCGTVVYPLWRMSNPPRDFQWGNPVLVRWRGHGNLCEVRTTSGSASDRKVCSAGFFSPLHCCRHPPQSHVRLPERRVPHTGAAEDDGVGVGWGSGP